MKTFFRCTNPAQTCELSRTHKIVSQDEWEVHSKESPGCSAHGEEVSFFEAQKKWFALSGIALVAAILLMFVLSFFKADPIKESIARIESELSRLEERLVEVESAPGDSASSGENSGSLARRAQNLKAEALAALKASNSNSAPKLQAQLNEIKIAVEGAKANVGSTTKKRDSREPELAALTESFTSLEDEIQSQLGIAEKQNASDSVEKLQELSDSVAASQARIRRLKKAVSARDERNGDDATKAMVLSNLSEAGQAITALGQIKKAPFDPVSADLRIVSSSVLTESLIGPLLGGWMEGGSVAKVDQDLYATRNDGKKVYVKSSEGGLFREFLNERFDLAIGMSDPTPDEVTSFEKKNQGAKLDSRATGQVIALDGLTLFSHPSDKRDVLTPKDLADGANLIGPVSGSEAERIALGFGFKFASHYDGSASEAVLTNGSKVSVGMFHEEGSNIRAKRVAFRPSSDSLSLVASPFSISTEDYKFSLRITAYNSVPCSPLALPFIRFVTSSPGQQIVAKCGYVDLNLKPAGGAVDPRIAAALGSALGIKKFQSAQRLSTNFRFASGRDDFDLKAQGDLERVPLQVAKDFPQGRVVILGFTDSTGNSAVNVPLSKRRAEVVAKELRKAAMDVATAGLGDQIPVDDNGTEEGKSKNRRSEIWVVIQ